MDITSLIQYYVNLIIIQYFLGQKATAEIALMAETFLADGVYFDVQNAYDLDTAVGVQLDVLGKYAGVDRYYSSTNLVNYFAMVGYDERLSLPSSPPRFGFDTYANYATSNDYNGTLQYADIITEVNSLFDSDFRTIIKLKISDNTSNFSHADIDNNIFAIFGNSVWAETNNDFNMTYFIVSSLSGTPLMQAILQKNLLPVPMAVGERIVQNVTGLMFGLVTYANQIPSPFEGGLCTYSNYGTLNGQCLTYSQIL